MRLTRQAVHRWFAPHDDETQVYVGVRTASRSGHMAMIPCRANGTNA
jgi:hypothetical protein